MEQAQDTPFPTPSLAAISDLGARLLAHFTQAGFVRADVPVLQPAEPFVELSGEDIRRRLFLTADAEGVELCLRPEFTIPAALDHIKAGAPAARKDLAFLGPVFRHRPNESGEFVQLGLESFGRDDREAADADVLAAVFHALTHESARDDLSVTIGDLALFSGLLGALALDAPMTRRLSLALSEGRIAALLDPARLADKKAHAHGLSRYSGVLDALKGADPGEARAFVTDLLSIAGVAARGWRSADDIAARFLEQAQGETGSLSLEQMAVLRRFLAIAGNPDQVVMALRALTKEAGLDLAAVLDRFETRIGFFEARGLDLTRIHAATSFARNLDYYSGFVFDMRHPNTPDRPVAGGGRYDRLFERLGHTVPAIGAAIWIERLCQAGDAG